MNILRLHYMLPVFAFLSGIVFGHIATGGFGKSPRPTDATQSLRVASVPGEAAAVRAGGLSATETPAAAAASLMREESLASARNSFERDPDLDTRLQAIQAAWEELQTDVARLRGRVDGLERQLSASTDAPGASDVTAARPSRPGTPEDRRSALVTAGVEEDRAADLVWRQGQQELDRLELRDIAMREGWFGSDRYRDELSQIDGEALDLRKEIGEDSYDRYLFASGEDNRVAIASIIPGSLAEDVGLQPGDLVESYGGRRVFGFEDLRTATAEGERDELVPVRIRRGDVVVDAWLPRGPLGVRLDRASADPDA